MLYTIEVQSEHPLIDMTVTNMAQKIAEELGHEGTHQFSLAVKSGERVIASWAEDPGDVEGEPGREPAGGEAGGRA